MRLAWRRAFQGGAVAHEVEAEARPLAFGAHPRRRQPDRRHQVAARQLGEYVGVDAVGLGGQRCQALDLLGVGERHVPAQLLELIADEAGAIHGLDGGADRLAVRGQPRGQAAQAVGVGRRGRRLEPRSVLIEQAYVHALP
jgi:hypothetical protein